MVDWIGSVFDPGSLSDHYRSATLFVYPSLADRGETFGLAPLEAMAHGCVPIVSSLECFREFIVNDICGVVFDHVGHGAEQRLISTIGELIRDKQRVGRLSLGAEKKASEFTLPRIAGEFLRDFENL